MKKFLLLFMAVFATAISMSAQTGSLVREGRVWNYNYVTYANWDGDIADIKPLPGYHFMGTQEKNGILYEEFRNGDDEVVALMRQDGGKVFIYVDENLNECISLEEGYKEYLIYDFDAKPGEPYVVYQPESIASVEVIESYKINVNNQDYNCQKIGYAPTQQCEFLIVDGIGPHIGLLYAPMMAQPTGSGGLLLLDNVTDLAGNELFTYDDFSAEPIQPNENFLIREDRIWVYGGSYSTTTFEYKMRFEGETIIDGVTYHNLHTFDSVLKDYYGLGMYNETVLGDGTTFLLREENGKIYLHAPINEDEGYWGMESQEALLYDFYANPGDEMTIVSSDGSPVDMTVVSTSEFDLNGERCKYYTICVADYPDWTYTIVEGIGNASVGCMPFIAVNIIARMPSANLNQGLIKVTDLEGNVICKRDEEGMWPWEAKVGIADVGTDIELSYDGLMVRAVGKLVAIYALSGKNVAEGVGEVSTESLQPGAYVAKAGGQTLKILVR